MLNKDNKKKTFIVVGDDGLACGTYGDASEAKRKASLLAGKNQSDYYVLAVKYFIAPKPVEVDVEDVD